MKLLRNLFPFLFLFLTISFTGCKFLKESAAKALSQCKFVLTKVDKQISFNEHVGNLWNYIITVHIAGTNPTSENISLGSYKLDLFVNDKLFTQMVTQDSIALTPHATTMIDIKAVFSPSGAWIVFWRNLLHKKIVYRIRGTFYLRLGNFIYPFAINLARWEENEN